MPKLHEMAHGATVGTISINPTNAAPELPSVGESAQELYYALCHIERMTERLRDRMLGPRDECEGNEKLPNDTITSILLNANRAARKSQDNLEVLLSQLG